MINIPLYTKNSVADIFANISYSQSGEDLIVKHIFESLSIKRPSYLDIGAYHPFHLNNTAIFYLSGSRGINIEPNQKNLSLFQRERQRDINLNIALGNKKDKLNYYEMNVATLNTFSKEEVARYKKEGYQVKKISAVEVYPLDTILKKYWQGNFPQFLNLDVEGMEKEILRGIDFKKDSPIVICLETISFSSIGRGKKNYSLIDYLEKKGFLLYADTNINSIFVMKKIWQSRGKK